MLTTSVAVQAHRPIRTISMGPAAVLRWRSESITMAWPLLALATKRSPSVQVTCASTFMALILPARRRKLYHTAACHHTCHSRPSNQHFRLLLSPTDSLQRSLDTASLGSEFRVSPPNEFQ